MAAVHQEIRIKALRQGQAQERPIGEIRHALALFLAATARDFEGKLKAATPTKTGRSRAGWSVSASATGADAEILYFTMRVTNRVSHVSWILRGVLSAVGRVSLTAARLKIGVIIGESATDFAVLLADQIGKTVSFSGFHFTIVGQSQNEIILTVS